MCAPCQQLCSPVSPLYNHHVRPLAPRPPARPTSPALLPHCLRVPFLASALPFPQPTLRISLYPVSDPPCLVPAQWPADLLLLRAGRYAAAPARAHVCLLPLALTHLAEALHKHSSGAGTQQVPPSGEIGRLAAAQEGRATCMQGGTRRPAAPAVLERRHKWRRRPLVRLIRPLPPLHGSAPHNAHAPLHSCGHGAGLV